MKKGSKLCIIINIVCCVFILLVVAAISAFYYFLSESTKIDPGFCTRKHAAMAMECAKKDDELGAAAASLNHTNYLLLPPSDYESLHGLCKITLQCAREIKCKAIRNILNDMSICGFVFYYTKEFSECANTLYEQRNESKCLSEIYNKKERTSDETCKLWKSSTTCVKEAIKSTCNDKLGILQYKWENRAKKADPIYCNNVIISASSSHEIEE